MANTHIIIDTLNLFFRAIHTVSPSLGIDAQTGMAVHTILNSVRKSWRMFDGELAVFAHEGKSWRKQHYPKYKLNRELLRAMQTAREQEDSKILFEALGDLVTYLKTETNVRNIQCPVAEADDMIAIWVQTHPDDNHVIVSSDSDFVQLLKHPNVTIYNGVTDIIMTQEGVFNDKKQRLEFEVKSDGKIKVGKVNDSFRPEPDWYEYAIFLKKIRGDKSDNIFSAYPGARIKGTKNIVGIREAFEDRHSKGFKWNNFFLQRWVNEDQEEMVVKTQYELNHTLIDLEAQPEDIRTQCIAAINDEKDSLKVDNVGIRFMQFCGRWKLNKLSDSATDFAKILNSRQ